MTRPPNVQKFIQRNRSPRVHIEYEVETYGMTKRIALPLIIGVMADLSGRSTFLDGAHRITIDVDNFDHVLRELAPEVELDYVSSIKDPASTVTARLRFESLDDFDPGAIATRLPSTQPLIQARGQLVSLLAYVDGRSDAAQLVSRALQDPALLASRPAHKPPLAGDSRTSSRSDVEPRSRLASSDQSSESYFAQLLKSVLKPRSPEIVQRVEESVRTLMCQSVLLNQDVGENAIASIPIIIARIDAALGTEVQEILHHPEFQRLESAWRGLHFLVANCETAADLKIRVWDISKRDLATRLSKYRGVAWDQSPIFRGLLTEEYGICGGEPYACMIGDYEFSHHAEDVEALSEMAKICSSAMAPFITGASPELLGMGSWRELINKPGLQTIPSGPDYLAWNSLRASDNSRFLVLTMPRFLGRLPYGSKTQPVSAFDYEEHVGEQSGSQLPWCNASYAMAVNIARAFRLHGTFARIRGVESGGVISGLPMYAAALSEGGIDTRCPTEIGITDRREVELSEIGLNALCHFKNTEYAVFVSAQTLFKTPSFEYPKHTADVARAALLPYVMSVCQFGRTMRCLLRDQIGSFRGPETTERMLNEWLDQYVALATLPSGSDDRARRPLSSARVRVSERPGVPGAYSIQLEISPAYQLDSLSSAMRLTFSS